MCILQYCIRSKGMATVIIIRESLKLNMKCVMFCQCSSVMADIKRFSLTKYQILSLCRIVKPC